VVFVGVFRKEQSLATISASERGSTFETKLEKPERDIVTDGRGNAGDYLLRRIARESPALLGEIGKDKRLKSF